MPYDPDKHGRSSQRWPTQGPVRIVGPGFRERVYKVVQLVPAGCVTTYGDIGSVLGSPTVARQVGYALAALPVDRDDVPWHRVINAKGHISFRGDPIRGGEQSARLKAEGLAFDAAGKVVDFEKYRFRYDAPR